jgi:hypothetical protein
MIIVRHRRNSRAELEATPRAHGVEVDLRSAGERLIIHHDPFVDGELFEDWLAAYGHRLLILNVKEEGLEERLLALMARHRIEDFFFLDQSFPFLLRTARTGERRTAVRVSEYEAVETALALAGMVEWVWVDCFSRFPLRGAEAARLKEAGFKLCLVSPELQGRPEPQEVAAMRALIAAEGITLDAVCTKVPELWA